MHSPSLSHDPGYDRRCVTFARWFHGHGISWSGTPSELVSELSSAGFADTSPAFSDSGELLAFLELNTQTLWELEVQALVEKRAGRPRRITLQSPANEDHHDELALNVESAEGLESPEPLETTELFENTDHFDSAELPSPEGSPNQQILGVAPPTSLESEELSSAGDLQPQVDWVLNSATMQEPSLGAARELPKYELTVLDKSDGPAVHNRALLIAVALFLVAIGALVFALSKRGNGAFAYSKADPNAALPTAAASESRVQESSTPAQDASGGDPSNNPDAKSAKANPETPDRTIVAASRLQDLAFEDLYREASQATSPSPQRELAIRYAEGRGVQRDRVAAYTWLVLAHSNGGTENDDMLRKLGGKLSQIELQKVRISIADSYARGVGVPRDLVSAHSWFALAEVAGSADATLRKKTLEASMTPAQIKDAEDRTTEWLSRHSARVLESPDSVTQ